MAAASVEDDACGGSSIAQRLGQRKRDERSVSVFVLSDEQEKTTQQETTRKRKREVTVSSVPFLHKTAEMVEAVKNSVAKDGMQLIVTFDGACRGNGLWGRKGKTVQGSCAAIAFLIDTTQPMTTAVKAYFCATNTIENATNNKAELGGLGLALDLIKDINAHTQWTQFILAGDSEYVLGSLRRGAIDNLTAKKSDQPNWEEWDSVRTLHGVLSPQIHIERRWIPRSANRASDRFCNNVLDDQPLDVDYIVVNPPIVPSFDGEDYIARVFGYVTESRHASSRVLAPILNQPWKVTFFNLLRLLLDDLTNVEFWMALLLMPKILLFPQAKKKQLSFISSNSSVEAYLAVFRATIGAAEFDSGPIQFQSTKEERIVSLVAQNRVSQACDLLAESDIAIREPNRTKALQFWPRADDDAKFRFDDQHAETTYGELYAQLRRMHAGKSPDITGWTKELLSPIFHDATDSEKLMLQSLFMAISNETLPRDVNKLLYSSDGMFLGNDQKERPIVNTSIWSKLLWRVAFHRTMNHFPSSNSAVQSTFLQLVVSEGNTVIKLDGKNAFQSLRREFLFQAIRHIDEPLFRRMWNRSYGRTTPILLFKPSGKKAFEISAVTGVLAGCVSAAKLFEKAIVHCFKLTAHMVSYVDDIHYILPKGDRVEAAYESLQRLLEPTGINFFGHKTKVVTPSPTTPAFLSLGAVINPGKDTNSVMELFRAKLKPTLDRMEKLVAIDIPLQVKLFLLRNLELRCRYILEASRIVEAQEWAEICDRRIIATISTLFELDGAPRAHQALITLPIGEGGLGLAQLSARRQWAQQKTYVAFVTAWKDGPEWIRDPRAGVPLIDPPILPSGKVDDAIAQYLINKLNGENESTNDITDNLILSCWRQQYRPQRHLLCEVPADPFRLSDDATRALVWTKLAYLPRSIQVPCKIATGDTRFNHVMTCKQCQQVTARHNSVVYELARLLPKIGIVTKANPSWLPHPDTNMRMEDEVERTTAGPDLILYTRPTTCIDVCVTGAHRGYEERADRPGQHSVRDLINQWEQRKDSKYQRWHEHYRKHDSGITCHPFVLTTTGHFGGRSIALLKQLTKDKKEARWFIGYTQLRIQRELAEMLAVIYKSMAGQRLALSEIVATTTSAATPTSTPSERHNTPTSGTSGSNPPASQSV